MLLKEDINYPYLPVDGIIDYVPADNPYMKEAKNYARAHSLDEQMPNGSVLVKSGVIIGRGANGSAYHAEHGCERVRRGVPTGQGYELCEGCHPKNHSEPKAIADATKNNRDTSGANVYLWGHWWCCQPCWQAMKAAGVSRVFLLEDSQKLFNRDNPANIVGRQFAD